MLNTLGFDVKNRCKSSQPRVEPPVTHARAWSSFSTDLNQPHIDQSRRLSTSAARSRPGLINPKPQNPLVYPRPRPPTDTCLTFPTRIQTSIGLVLDPTTPLNVLGMGRARPVPLGFPESRAILRKTLLEACDLHEREFCSPECPMPSCALDALENLNEP